MVRSSRLALLQTSFPTIHWVCMGLLGASIVMLFLIETDEQALQFLDLLQLRAILTVLIGALTGIASICIDLNDPFRGSFRITQSAAQLSTPGTPHDPSKLACKDPYLSYLCPARCPLLRALLETRWRLPRPPRVVFKLPVEWVTDRHGRSRLSIVRSLETVVRWLNA